MYCIIVKIRLTSGTKAQFLPEMIDNAEKSVTREEGCLVFDVLEDTSETDTVYLYEIYQNPEALEYHKTTEHYKNCRSAIGNFIREQSVVRTHVRAKFPGVKI